MKHVSFLLAPRQLTISSAESHGYYSYDQGTKASVYCIPPKGTNKITGLKLFPGYTMNISKVLTNVPPPITMISCSNKRIFVLIRGKKITIFAFHKMYSVKSNLILAPFWHIMLFAGVVNVA